MKIRIISFAVIVYAIISLLSSTRTTAQVVLYGVTSQAGDYGSGTVFSVTPTGNLTIISRLNETYASVPYGSLLYASDGNFYASSLLGGYGNSCTIFRCSPTGGLKTMIDLDSVWGKSAPEGNNLIQGMDGNLYGMTTFGGKPNYSGVLFKLQLSGQYSALHLFADTGGYWPYGSLTQTSDSLLWGMTQRGGVNDKGAIFHCTTSGVYTRVYSFDSVNGMAPYGDLLLASDGNFYGLTLLGGKNNAGTLFRYNPSGIFTKLVDFGFTGGYYPYGSLIQASDSNLYGLTSVGGPKNDGTIFRCTLSGSLTTIASFNDTNGSIPKGTLIQASDGYLYGVTSYGGKNNYGTIFQSSTSGNLINLVDFDTNEGTTPVYEKLIEVDTLKTAGVTKLSNTNNFGIYPNPNNGQFTLVCNSKSLAIMEVYNVLGEKVYSETLGAINGINNIDIGSQPNGIYLYRIIGESGNLIGEGKLIIQK